MKTPILGLFCLIPQLAAAAGVPDRQNQAAVTVSCASDDCHLIPWFRGEGGLVGTRMNADDPATDDSNEGEVTYIAECGSVVRTGAAATDAEGIVRLLFTFDNGLACLSEGGRFRITNLAPGGWYWINDDVNSAVASLIHEDGLGASRIDPVDPGGVVMTGAENGAVTFVKHEPSGRVGLLSNLELSVPDTPCRGKVEGACTLGSADAWVLNAGRPAGATVELGSKDVVVSFFLPPEAGFVVRYPEGPDPNDPPPMTPEEIAALLESVVPTFSATAELTCKSCSPSYPLPRGMRFDDETDDDNGDGTVDELDTNGGGAAGQGLPGFGAVEGMGAFHFWQIEIPLMVPDPDNPTGPMVLTEWCRETHEERFRPVEITVDVTLSETPSSLVHPLPSKRSFTSSFKVVCPAALKP